MATYHPRLRNQPAHQPGVHAPNKEMDNSGTIAPRESSPPAPTPSPPPPTREEGRNVREHNPATWTAGRRRHETGSRRQLPPIQDHEPRAPSDYTTLQPSSPRGSPRVDDFYETQPPMAPTHGPGPPHVPTGRNGLIVMTWKTHDADIKPPMVISALESRALLLIHSSRQSTP